MRVGYYFVNSLLAFAIALISLQIYILYENEKILGEIQTDCFTTKRKRDGIYKSLGLYKTVIKCGIPLLVKALNRQNNNVYR